MTVDQQKGRKNGNNDSKAAKTTERLHAKQDVKKIRRKILVISYVRN